MLDFYVYLSGVRLVVAMAMTPRAGDEMLPGLGEALASAARERQSVAALHGRTRSAPMPSCKGWLEKLRPEGKCSVTPASQPASQLRRSG